MRLWRGRRAESVHDYAGVLIPLEEAHLHSYSARSGRTEYEEPPDEDDGDGDGDDAAEALKDAENEGTGMLEMRACEYSIEGLRREVRRGGKGEWSEYESAFPRRVCGGCGAAGLERDADPGLFSEVQAAQQGHSGHRHGPV